MMNTIKSLFLQLFELVCHLLPVSNKKIFFLSFAGQYNDNPKAISEKLHEISPETEQYWAISNKSNKNDIPPYIHQVEYGSLKSVYIKNRCKVVVDNGAGIHLLYTDNKLFFRVKKHLKNRKQFNISTWHGNPIKHIGAQIPGAGVWTKDTAFSSSDLLISGCSLVKDIFEKAFINLMPVELLGTPRTDILFDNSDNFNIYLRNKLGLPVDKKILLYAPTYRYSPKDSGVEQLHLMDLNCLMSTLQAKFGGDWVMVMRVHNMVLMEIKESGMLENFRNLIYDGNRYDDMNEYLRVCDALLTDYSGCIYDVALTNKPCFLYAHDRKHYEEKERGVYTPLSFFPYSFANTFEELTKNIMSYDKNVVNDKRCVFLNNIGNVEDGNASMRVVNLLEGKMK